MFSMKDIIELALQIEENAASVYARAAAGTEDPALKATLECLANDEQQRVGRLGDLLKSAPKIETSADLERLGRALMREVIGEQSFSLGDADFAELEQPEELLALAVRFESDKRTFYQILRSFAQDEAADRTLETIISEESTHIEHLRRLMGCRREEAIPASCPLC